MSTYKQRNKKVITYLVGVAFIVGFLFFLNYLGEKNSGGSADSTADNLSGGKFSGNATQIQEDDWVKGNSRSNVSIIEYGDFQCPACASYSTIIKEIMEKYGDKIKLAYRHFPLTQIHPLATPSAIAAEAAGKQGKFWEMHDMLYEKQREWSAGNISSANSFFVIYAKELGLDPELFAEDLKSDEIRGKVSNHLASANKLGLNSTPSFLLNGEKIQTPGNFEGFSTLIEATLKNAPLPNLNKDDLISSEEVHEHADLFVYLNGKKLDFSQTKYQSDETNDDRELDPFAHLHNNDGDIIHKHKAGLSLSYFFKTLGMELTDTCFTTDNNEKFCSDDKNSLKFFVNGVRKESGQDYIFTDLDKILISYGPLVDSELQKQIKSVSDDSCVYSKTCPERGPAPEENCVGGPGITCSQ